MFTPVKPPYLIRRFYNDLIWQLPGENNEVYLTFDDGPIPEVTEFVLDTLALFHMKATFFCVGNNVKSNPDLYKRIVNEGHRIGNHTFSHRNGWRSTVNDYLDDIEMAANYITSNLFRPPYGRIKKCQAGVILPAYKIIMWDVISYDFDPAVSPAKCLRNVTNNTVPGSIVVFHDNVKSFRNLESVLPLYLDFLKNNNFKPVLIP